MFLYRFLTYVFSQSRGKNGEDKQWETLHLICMYICMNDVCVCVHDLRQAEVHSPLCLCLQVLGLEVCATIPCRSAILEDYTRKG